MYQVAEITLAKWRNDMANNVVANWRIVLTFTGMMRMIIRMEMLIMDAEAMRYISFIDVYRTYSDDALCKERI